MPDSSSISAAHGLAFDTDPSIPSQSISELTTENPSVDLIPLADDLGDSESGWTDVYNLEVGTFHRFDSKTQMPGPAAIPDFATLILVVVTVSISYLALVSFPVTLLYQWGFSMRDPFLAVVAVGMLLDVVFVGFFLAHIMTGSPLMAGTNQALSGLMATLLVWCLMYGCVLGWMMLPRFGVLASAAS